MRLRRAQHRQMPETIIALIDVVFFLLVFFMLIGRMDATAPFEVRPATAQTGADMPAGGTTLSISATGALALDGIAIAAPDLIPALAAQLAETPDLLIRVNAHRDAQLHRVLPLVAEIEHAGARTVVLVVTPEGS
ncbi:MAG: biopolymer transporter ExbD [Paracoccaceae bacterium]